jgi:oligoribonuclease (3'-5' exoribonuclease)
MCVCLQEYKRAPRKVMAHTALSDIRESIEELQYYRNAIFKAHSGKGSTKGKGR